MNLPDNPPLLIVGAGLAGLIAARTLIDLKPVIAEKQESLPNNHNALLRFRSDVVSTATNIPFRRVRVTKAVCGSVNPVSDAIRYSLKVTGKLQNRSILSLDPVERWIAPGDLVSRLATTAEIYYGCDFEDLTLFLWKQRRPTIISTLPMPYMMKVFEWPNIPNFTHQEGWTARGKIRPEFSAGLNCTVYFPGSEPWYRVSITDDNVIVEGVGACASEEIGFYNTTRFDPLEPFGLSWDHLVGPLKVKRSTYQKIGELTSSERESAKRFIMWLTEKHGIYCLGRFATWRPKLLLDDIVNDVHVIRRLMGGDSMYDKITGKLA